MFRTTLVLLAVMACVQARPQLLNQGVPVSPSSSGTANSGITKGETVLPTGGVSTLVQQQAATGGQAASGGSNIGSASGNTQSQTGLLGTSSSSNTNAQSVQNAGPTFGNFGGGFVMPSFPAIPGFGTGSAQGQSGSNIVKGETIGPHGGSTNIVQQQSGTGGQASNGGFNVGTASGNTQSQTGLLGTSSSSNTNAQSQQGSLPGFGTFGGAFPAVPPFPGFGQGSAQGQAGSSVIKGETINPFGGSSTVVQQQASTGGQAANGGVNVGSASSNNQNLNTPLGSSSSSNTNSQSSQFTNPGFGGVPGLPGLPVIPGFGSATGTAGSQLTQGKTTGPDGSQTTITQLGSSAGGSASNGGSSVNQASGSTSSIDGVSGSQTQSNLNSQSVQTGR
ncbi:hypothetical protein FJT64_022080 [Amphibalanus amphitrite]|uniref:Uncharacterized protein n=1 Tax=Amphibalanus amphitrite TaxID=1232801 RepID=A0A6A4WI12_AMPAM|nr:uncharacterized transmembrane protein DDB_G0289901-like [Amphibalanus amphitrite]KAF0306055.1 hypothetical protein FJT64_022365 [Amphibalanus amphitrite]KAF0306375.1 hypothetical protein FJT64_022080 [Amphibalanus amphitrite]